MPKNTAPYAKIAAVPLNLCVRRLAPIVAAGMVTHSEALDTIMLIAIERHWERYQYSLLSLEEWMARALTREAERCLLSQRASVAKAHAMAHK